MPDRTHPRRALGLVHSAFPPMSPLERFFICLGVASGLLAVLITKKNSNSQEDQLVALLVLPGCVLAYWMRQAPAAILQFLILPHSGIGVRWWGWLQRCVQIFGVVTFLLLPIGAVAIVLGPNKEQSPWTGLLELLAAITALAIILRKRKGVRL